jgi:NADPH-dependent F420 reductase
MQVGIVGGTGPAGKALAARLASVGVDVTVGSRSAERGEEIAAEIASRWPALSLSLTGGSNEDAARAAMCVVATPWDAAVSTAAALSAALSGKVVISMANALARVGDEFQALVPARGSIAASLQCALPGSRVAGAFHHLPARHLAAIDRPIEADVLVCADDEDAVAATIALVEAMPGLRGVDAGSLSACGAIEAFTAVLLGVNVRHKALASLTLTGLPDRAAR